MASARNLYRLHLTLGALAVGAVALALAVTVRAVDFAAPSLSKLVTLCQQALVSGVELHRVALLTLAGLSALVVLRATRSAARQLLGTCRFMRTLRVVDRARTAPAAFVIEDTSPRAFCAGYLRARVYVSTGTLALLSDSQLEAVIAHEAHHARRRDPLRMLVAQMIAEGVFFVPVLRRSRERYAALAEVAADEAAVGISGCSGPLAAALLAFDTHGGLATGVAPERVDHLTGRRRGWDVPPRDLVGGVLTVTALGAAAAAAGLTTAAGGFTIASVALSSCTIALAAVPVFSVIAAARLLRRRVA